MLEVMDQRRNGSGGGGGGGRTTPTNTGSDGGLSRFGGSHRSSCLTNRYSSPNIHALIHNHHPNCSGGSGSAGASPVASRESSPLLLKRAIGLSMLQVAGNCSSGQCSPVSQHEKLHSTLKRSNSLKRILRMPLFGGP
ncbi:uncharacterized protein LOC125179492, partial [Hyalella azteca]|uniref:Uncharacterized protein LOC125179492 n=1 Tax=Hyalella azteca TaxID=294128 RepID=A0A979FXX3_HYAAZ